MAMRRYAAFLRGVTPMNARMSDLKRCLEDAGFDDVRTLLSSGNVLLSAPAASEASIERRVESALETGLGRTFLTIARPVEALRAIVDTDPFAGFDVPAGAKRVVTFLRASPAKLSLPIEVDGARILCLRGREVFTAYVRSPRGPVFMTLIEKTFGDAVTTRTWDTVRKVARR